MVQLHDNIAAVELKNDHRLDSRAGMLAAGSGNAGQDLGVVEITIFAARFEGFFADFTGRITAVEFLPGVVLEQFVGLTAAGNSY